MSKFMQLGKVIIKSYGILIIVDFSAEVDSQKELLLHLKLEWEVALLYIALEKQYID